MFTTDGVPETDNEFEVLRLFPDDKIAALAGRLPSFASDEVRDALPLQVRLWAVLILNNRASSASRRDELRREGKNPAQARRQSELRPSEIRKELLRAAKALERAGKALRDLSSDAEWLLTVKLTASPDECSKAGDFITNLAEDTDSLAIAAECVAKGIKVDSNRPKDLELRAAVQRLGYLYRWATGLRPTMRFDAYETERYGPFREFAYATLEPLFPGERCDQMLADACAELREDARS